MLVYTLSHSRGAPHLAEDSFDGNRPAMQGALKHQRSTAAIPQNLRANLHAPHSADAVAVYLPALHQMIDKAQFNPGTWPRPYNYATCKWP